MSAVRRRVLVIGIGAGSPAHLTLQAVEAIRQVDVFLVPDKGEATEQLRTLRSGMLEQHRPDGDYVLRSVPDPRRGPDGQRDAAAYDKGVRDWHAARARLLHEEIAALPEGAVVGFLVWGDPALYDSTLRVLDTVAERLPLAVEVVPGISAVQALAAEHRIVLNSIGGPVHLTTGRRLADEWRPDLGTVVVVLDPRLACRELLDRAPDLHIHWGAYLGLPQQVLRTGPLGQLADELVALRDSLRAEHGWVMDTYALTLPP